MILGIFTISVYCKTQSLCQEFQVQPNSISMLSSTHLCREHVEELEQLEVGVLYGHGRRPDHHVQGVVSHLHQRHQPHLNIAVCFHRLL